MLSKTTLHELEQERNEIIRKIKAAGFEVKIMRNIIRRLDDIEKLLVQNGCEI